MTVLQAWLKASLLCISLCFAQAISGRRTAESQAGLWSKSPPTSDEDPYRYLKATPWLVRRKQLPAYSGLHNDLDKLLSVQNKAGRITWTVSTRNWIPVLMNWVYSLVAIGRVESFIVVALDPTFLIDCLNLNLPCYNGTGLDPGLTASIPAIAEMKPTDAYFKHFLKWKPSFTWLLLQKGYEVHYSDPDVVFVKDVYMSLTRKCELFYNDGMAMRELFPGNIVNMGHYLLKPNERTLALAEVWATGGNRKAEWEQAGSDQEWLHKLRGEYWETCYSGYNCTVLRRHGIAAIQGYQEQGTGWFGEQCLNHHKWWPCADHAVALHFMCIPGGQGSKIKYMQKYDVWYYDYITSTDGLRKLREEKRALPCADELAWRLTTMESAYGEVWHDPTLPPLFDQR